MENILSTIGMILAALFVFGLLIFVHELGHFIMAKLMGVRVIEFALGMGPRLISFGKKGTKYSLRLLPIGGFCAMEGEDPETPMPEALGGHKGKTSVPQDGPVTSTPQPGEMIEDVTADTAEQPSHGKKNKRQPGPLYSKKVWQRVLITVAGAVMNLVLGFVLLVGYFAFCQPTQENGEVLYPTTTIFSVQKDSKPYQTGLRDGDTILKVNGRRVFTVDYDMTVALSTHSSPDGVFDLTVRRTVDGKPTKVELEGVAFNITQDGYIDYQDFVLQGEPQTVLSTLEIAAKSEYGVGMLVWRSLGDLLRGKYGLKDISGPVGTMDIIGDVASEIPQSETPQQTRMAVGRLLMIVILITVNLGVLNLLPFPALDGGRLIFLMIEGITRRPVPPKYEGMIHFIGLVLLMLLMLVVTFSDLMKIFG